MAAWKDRKHDIGWWVETRADALQESYYLLHYYGFKGKTHEKEAQQILINLAKTLDQSAKDEYVDPNYKRSNTY